MSALSSITVPANLADVPQVTDQELAKYADLIYRIAGVRVSPQKKTLLSNRLRRRLKETGIKSFEAYYQHLKQTPASSPEWDAFLQEITTHETYLFRDDAHWKWFQETYLKDLANKAKLENRPKTLRVWSAACSTGDEACTIACCIAGGLAGFEQWKISIVGTDIGIGAVEAARAQEFGPRAMRLVPEGFCKKFFAHDEAKQRWKAKPVLTCMLNFKQHNLMQVLSEQPFDLVFVKNVLIYFDRESKQVVLDNIRKKMRPGSLLVCGGAEGISDQLKDMQRISSWLYAVK